MLGLFYDTGVNLQSLVPNHFHAFQLGRPAPQPRRTLACRPFLRDYLGYGHAWELKLVEDDVETVGLKAEERMMMMMMMMMMMLLLLLLVVVVVVVVVIMMMIGIRVLGVMKDDSQVMPGQL